jgi:hypothetical protein
VNVRVQDSTLLGVAYDQSGGIREPIHYTAVSTHMLASTRVTGLTSTHLLSMLAMPRTGLDECKDLTRDTRGRAAVTAAGVSAGAVDEAEQDDAKSHLRLMLLLGAQCNVLCSIMYRK